MSSSSRVGARLVPSNGPRPRTTSLNGCRWGLSSSLGQVWLGCLYDHVQAAHVLKNGDLCWSRGRDGSTSSGWTEDPTWPYWGDQFPPALWLSGWFSNHPLLIISLVAAVAPRERRAATVSATTAAPALSSGRDDQPGRPRRSGARLAIRSVRRHLQPRQAAQFSRSGSRRF